MATRQRVTLRSPARLIARIARPLLPVRQSHGPSYVRGPLEATPIRDLQRLLSAELSGPLWKPRPQDVGEGKARDRYRHAPGRVRVSGEPTAEISRLLQAPARPTRRSYCG